MNWEPTIRLRSTTALLYQHAREWVSRLPARVRIVIGLFGVAALLMALHTALTAKDATLHLKLQHDSHHAQVSVWVDDDLAYSGNVTGSARKKFGLIPTDSMQGSLSQIIAVRSGEHSIRVRIEPDDGVMQEDSISGKFASKTERVLSVSARHSGISLSWQGSGSAPGTVSIFATLSSYAGSLLLTLAGSIVSAVAGYAIKELPARLRSASDSVPKI